MTDLLQKLKGEHVNSYYEELCREAADEIEKLRKELEEKTNAKTK